MESRPGKTYVQAELMPPPYYSKSARSARKFLFKHYVDADQIALPHPTTSLETLDTRATFEQIGQLLFETYGLMQQVWILDANVEQAHPGFKDILRRPVPSGGALFPCECYVFVGPGQHIPAGMYHYDVAHHALDVLRQVNAIDAVIECLACPEQVKASYVLAFSCFFWKDGCKYDAFSYRLQSFDLGTVVAQYTEILNTVSVPTQVHYQFLDQRLNALLGLDYLHESVYAVVTMNDNDLDRHNAVPSSTGTVSSDTGNNKPMPTAPQLESIARWPLPVSVHRASLNDNREDFRVLHSLPAITAPPSIASHILPMVHEDMNLASWRQRHSTSGRFIPVAISELQLARLLKASSQGYQNDIDGRMGTIQHVLLYCIVNRVQNIPPGVYYYNAALHTLELVVAGDVRAELQQAKRASNYNMYDVSVCLFPVGNYDAGFLAYGDRWYRMQNMEAGIMVQRLYLTTSMLKIGCRASLGFKEQQTNTLLQLPDGLRALIMLMIAPESPAFARYEQPLLI